MRRLSPSLVFVLTLTAALLAGAAVFLRPGAALACTQEPMALEEAVRGAQVIVVAGVTSSDGSTAVLKPEAYLKGPADGQAIQLTEYNAPGCEFPELNADERVLALLTNADGRFLWPEFSQLYVLNGGQAVGGAERQDVGTEQDLVARIRAQTNQYAVPAASKSEGAGIDWLGTVVPVAGALLVVFAIGLVLMRVWHRIDPT